MIPNPTILIVAPDGKLPDELATALRGLTEVQAVTHVAPDFRHGVEAARCRRPDLAVVEMTTDLRGLKLFAEEAAVVAPETVVAAAFSPDVFGPNVSESAVLIEAMRAGVRDFLRRPLSSAELEQLLLRLHRQHIATVSPAPLGRIVSFLSNKGGVGKSTLAVNLACGLARRYPRQVLLIDGSLQMGVCATMLDLKPATSLTDAVQERDRLDEVLLRQLATPHPSGLHLLASPADALEAARVDDEIMARVLTLARRAYDYVIVDSFPMLDRVVMTVLDLSDRTYLVVEAVVPTVLGTARLIGVLDELGFARERQRLVLNRFSGFAGNLKAEDVARRLGRPIDHVIPYEKRLLIAANVGKPFVLSASRWFSALARKMDALVNEVERIEVQQGAVTGKLQARPSANGKGGDVVDGEVLAVTHEAETPPAGASANRHQVSG